MQIAYNFYSYDLSPQLIRIVANYELSTLLFLKAGDDTCDSLILALLAHGTSHAVCGVGARSSGPGLIDYFRR